MARAAFDAFNRGEIEAFLEGLDAEVEWHPEFQTMLLGGEAREFHGREGVRTALREWYEVLAEVEVEITSAAGRIQARWRLHE